MVVETNVFDRIISTTSAIEDMDPLAEAAFQNQERNEANPVIKKTPVSVEDTEKINSLTSEVEALKASLQSERQATEDLRKAFSEAEAKNSELATGLENATRKVDQLCESVQRLEEKLSNSESEIQVLRLEALPTYPTIRAMATMLLLQENQEVLVKCISQNLGYDGGKPVAASVIYKCLLHWKSFEVDGTNIFNLIVQTIASAIEVSDDNEVLVYWLSNLATLVCLLQRTFSSATIPAASQRFKQQLIDLLEKIYGMIRDNLKKEIAPLLESRIQAPKTANAVAPQAQIAHWQSIRKSLNSYLNLMKVNNVPLGKVFTQIFSFINVKLFNSVLLRRDRCSFSHGEYVQAGLGELDQWCVEATDEYAGSAWDELRHISQAVGFLLILEKEKMTLDYITSELCPVLSIQQLYRISSMYLDDKYDTHSVPLDVIANMRVIVIEELRNAISSSCFLLDDDSSIPFTVEDISKSMEQVDVNAIEPPKLIRETQDFSFLLTHEEGSPS